MSEIYDNYHRVEVERGELASKIRTWEPINNLITLDTETCGLYVDGNWASDDAKCQPKARVSVVSLAWWESCPDRDNGGCSQECLDDGFKHIRTIALPFDQGRSGGKQGRYKDGAFEVLPHTDSCVCSRTDTYLTSATSQVCVCAPWNLGLGDWEIMCQWLRDKNVIFHNAKFDMHIMNAGLREAVRDEICGFGLDLQQNMAWDTMLAQGIIEPLNTSGLKPTAERLFGVDSRDEEAAILAELKTQGAGLTKRYDLVSWEVVGPYAAKDAELTLKLYDWQQANWAEGIMSAEDRELIDGEFDLCKVLYRMELRRVGVDVPEMLKAQHDMEAHIKTMEAELPWMELDELTLTTAVPGVTLLDPRVTFKRPTKPKGEPKANISWAKWWCFGFKSEGALELMPVKVTDAGSPGLDTEVVARFAKDNVPGMKQWQDIAKCNSALSKWYRAWPEKAIEVEPGQWRLMTNFRQGRIESDRRDMKSGGAISGRLSAERVQLQGFPDDYKIPDFVTPPKKLIRGKKVECPKCKETTQHTVTELDISNAEVRVAAWLMQSPSLAKACETGNVHSANTVLMAHAFGMVDSFPGGWSEGVAYDAFQVDEWGDFLRDDEGKKMYVMEKHPQWGMYRKVMKTTVLGLFFGAGVTTLKAQIDAATKMDFPVSKVKDFMALTMKVIPEWKGVSTRMQRKADKTLGGVGYIRLVNGRKRWFGWGERTHKAFNSGTQGGVAETMKGFMVWVDKNYPGALINQVHDSMWLEFCPCEQEKAIKEIKNYGEELFTRTFSTEEVPIKFELDSKLLTK